MTQVSGFTFFWGLLGMALLMAGTAVDVWMAGNEYVGDFVTDGAFIKIKNPRKEFGTTQFREIATQGWGYAASNVCPQHGIFWEIQQVSDGMVALLILTNIVSFVSTLSAILASTNSTIVATLKPARTWSIAACICNLVTWALWLRGHMDNLHQNNHRTCHFTAQISASHNSSNLTVSMGGSFGLVVIAMGIYAILAATCHYLIVKYGENSPASNQWITCSLAIVGFAAIFVASNYNSWSTSVSSKADRELERYYDNILINPNSPNKKVANVRVDSSTLYGVYTTQYTRIQTYIYVDKKNQDHICPLNGGLDSTGSEAALIQGGQVVLGFCVTGISMAFAALMNLSKHPTASFYNFVGASCSCIVALLVWNLVSYYVIQLHCCHGPECGLGASFGLVAAAAFCFFAAVFQQAWIMYHDIFVMDPLANLKM